jgi:two-component system sensor histidine kinase SaeS
LVLLTAFLLASGGISLVVGYAALHIGQGKLVRTVRDKLLFALLFSTALVFINVGFTAYLMFFSAHDLKLLSLLMVFSLGVAALFAILISLTFHQRLRSVLKTVHGVGSGELGSRIDITGRDELDDLALAFNAMAEKLEEAFARQRDLEQARRQLVAMVSHDLRTPLATMRAMIESINDGVVTDAETIQRYLATLQHEIAYLSQLIDDLFELSQIDAGLLQLNLEPASLGDLISDTLEALSAQARRRQLTLRGFVDDAIPSVVMDTRRVQRVLYNLVQNAVRHTPADGAIVIRAMDTGPEVQVSVADTGEGIAADDLQNIFDRFRRERGQPRGNPLSGSGLGLTIARGIVELHGGRIWAESVQGQGATFTFTLPKNSQATAEARALPA